MRYWNVFQSVNKLHEFKFLTFSRTKEAIWTRKDRRNWLQMHLVTRNPILVPRYSAQNIVLYVPEFKIGNLQLNRYFNLFSFTMKRIREHSFLNTSWMRNNQKSDLHFNGKIHHQSNFSRTIWIFSGWKNCYNFTINTYRTFSDE